MMKAMGMKENCFPVKVLEQVNSFGHLFMIKLKDEFPPSSSNKKFTV